MPRKDTLIIYFDSNITILPSEGEEFESVWLNRLYGSLRVS